LTAAKASLLTPEALDFAPDLLAIQERPPARMPRAILIAVVSLIGLLLVWAAFAQLDVIATADGRLVPLTFTKIVQPADAGVVTEILVHDGDQVKEGQVLMRLDPRLSQADTAALAKDVALRQLTLRRVEAELSDRPFLPRKSDHAELYGQVEAQFRARRQAYLDAIAQENETLNKARADVRASEQVLSKLTQTLPSYKQSAEAYRKLVQEGFVGELAAAEKNRELVEKEQDLKTQEASVQSLNASIAQSERRISSLRSLYRSQLEDERIDTLTQLNKSGQELEKSSVKAGQLDIRAPNSGIVKDMATTNRGAVVAAGALLMNIVPKEEPLQGMLVTAEVHQGRRSVLEYLLSPVKKIGQEAARER
jgi:hemolysin D